MQRKPVEPEKFFARMGGNAHLSGSADKRLRAFCMTMGLPQKRILQQPHCLSKHGYGGIQVSS